MITARAERKVCLCAKLFDIFRGCILMRFVQNSVEILTWNFKKNYFGRIFQKFSANQGTKTCEILPYFLKIYSGSYCAEKIHTSSFICCLNPGREACLQKNHKKKIRGRKARTFYFRKTSFLHSRSRTYYPLLLGCFVLKVLPDVHHCVYWVLDEIWAPDSSHKIRNKFLFITARAARKVRLSVKLFDFFRGRILICLTWNLSRFVLNSVDILTWNFRKKLFAENFSEILCKPRLSSTETCDISLYFLQFYSGSVLRWNKFTQVLSYVVCTQVRRRVHKKITKKKDMGEKSQDVLFMENQFCSLSVWDLLRLTPLVF